MNAYQKAIRLNLTGTDAQKVAVLHTLTSGAIPVANVLQFFDEENLAELDPIDNAWVGTLIDVVKNPATPASLAAGLRKLFVHLAKRTSQTIDTTDPTIAVETFTLLTALIQMGVVTTVQRDAFYALDGGRPYAALTTPEFTELRVASETAETKQQAVDAVIARCTTVIEAAEAESRLAESTPETIAAAANTAWES